MKRIIYANSNHNDGKYLAEAVVSANSFRQFIPDCEIVLYTNQTGYAHEAFDQVFVVPFVVPSVLADKIHLNGQMLVKHQGMVESPAQWNLVLGSDTLALSEKVNDAFALLERFDFAAAHAPGRVTGGAIDVPFAWPEFNCDVIFFRKNAKTQQFLEEWQRLYATNEIDHPHDQGAFRYLTYHRDVRVATLPFEFNDRVGLFGSQEAADVRPNNRTVILQNRFVIAEILAGNSTIEEIVQRHLKDNATKRPAKGSSRSFLARVAQKLTGH